MRDRLELVDYLQGLFVDNPHVYFQPPSSVRMSYPAIVYSLYDGDKLFAGNDSYLSNRSYRVTVIDKDPDSAIAEKLFDTGFARFERSYVSDNLNHFLFIINLSYT